MVFEGRTRIWDFRRGIIITLVALAVLSGWGMQFLKYTFDFEQFFPKDDPEYEFFKTFIEEFETDDNFLLIAVENDPSIFDQSFLERIDHLTDTLRNAPHVNEVQSILDIQLPRATLFGFSNDPVLDASNPETYARDSLRIMSDERFAGRLVAENANSLLIYLKTIDGIDLDQANELMSYVKAGLSGWEEDEYHFVGRANFQVEMVRMQQREIMVSTGIAAILVSIIFFIIFRNPYIVFISLVSIGLSFVMFMGILAALGRELNAMSALYPVIMIIVGSSDVIHIVSKYIDEINKGLKRIDAMRISIKEIGTATFLTSITTAIGFSSLFTSKIEPVRDFGLNAGLGVLIAFGTVILFTTSACSLAPRRYFEGAKPVFNFWNKWMRKAYDYTLKSPRQILVITGIVAVLAAYGLSRVSTDYSLEENMPRKEKVTADFRFFNDQYYGFRPFEIAIFTKGDIDVFNPELLQDINKLENRLKDYEIIQGITSITLPYKSVNQALLGGGINNYAFPNDTASLNRISDLVSQFPQLSTDILVSRDKKKTRISANLQDVGADSLKSMLGNITSWINTNLNTDLATYRHTGTGVLVDRNAVYVRNDLVYGLGLAMLVVSLLMALLYQNVRLLIIALVPNILPLILAAAALGYANVELEASISIIFAVVFGIAVDDTIHFLSKYRLARASGLDMEESLLKTFVETGKAICLTTLILFFGFLVLLFSIHPPSQVVGMLISVTLISAVMADLFLIPLMIRAMGKR